MDAAPLSDARLDPDLVRRIDALLPQTQCTKCGFDGCLPYAQALARGDADINQCPPGGDAGIHALARLLDRPYLPLDPTHGNEQPRRVALIDEAACIGCTLCIQACPVDAIIGAPKMMHTVFTALCSGCDLCLPPCPVDCIEMVPSVGADADWTEDRRAAARERHLARNARVATSRTLEAERLAGAGKQAKQSVIDAALERARTRRDAP